VQMSNYYAFVALELARERAAEAHNHRLAALAEPGQPRTAGLRRGIARIALAVARAADSDAVNAEPATC
jgi:hypothetical protein